MSKFPLYLIIGIGVTVGFAVSGPFVIVLILIVWAISRIFPELKRKLDINGDGSLNFDDVAALFSSEKTAAKSKVDQESFLQQRMRTIWKNFEHKFVLLSIQVQKREASTRHWWSRLVPFSHGSKVNRIIENLAIELTDSELAMIRSDFMRSVSKLNHLDRQLNEVRTSIAMNAEPSGGSQHRAADKLQASIDKEMKVRAAMLQAFKARMTAYGIDLSAEQAEVLLSRVDAGDVSRMTTIFAIISSITSQFADAKIQTGENLDVTKKYYGIYLGLLELQIHIQNEYMEKLDAVYLPGVQRIGNEARDLMAETEVKLRASEQGHQSGYRQNIKSQQFTIEVTDIYATALRADRSKVEEARKIVSKLHELAENTLSTVRVSADLSTLVRQSEGLYKQVMSLQTPALVPFENLQMQREFEAVTQRLNNS
jgi:hypothetical protein